MAAGHQTWEHWLERLYNLRRDKRGSHERPHKPVLLLSIIDLLDRGFITDNNVPLSQELVATFRCYFDVVKESNDKPTIENPFFYLCGDKIWQISARNSDQSLYVEGNASRGFSAAQLREQGITGRFESELWSLLITPLSRHQLREALIARYFPEKREQLAALVVTQRHPDAAPDQFKEDLPPVTARGAAFRRIILEVYDYTCAACGLRIKVSTDLSLVEAAHIIPFSVGHNDKPNNGLALCPNHHWAMDRHLIAPCPDGRHREGIWQVSPRLEERKPGERELVALARKPVIPPKEVKFYPALESLRWRQEHLVTTY